MAAALVMVSLSRDATADEEADKISEITGYLRDIKGYLDGIASDSSYGDIDYALERASKVKEVAERIRSLGPLTDAGKKMANEYPGWVDKFKESAKYLREMKQAQLKQADLRLTEKCNEAQLRLRAEANRYVERNDPAGVQKIPEMAERAAYDHRDLLKSADETNREMERSKGYARNFSESDSYGWSDVKSELHDGANEIYCKSGSFKCDDVRAGDCDELRRRAEQARKCAAAREEINSWRYDNRDSGHADAAKNAKRAAEKCEERLREDKCR